MAFIKIGEPKECSVGSRCKYSVSNLGQGRAHCADCRLAPDNENVSATQWRPMTPRDRHPVLEQEKLDKRKQKAAASLVKRLGKDLKRRSVGKQAARSEAKAVKTLNVKPTVNSGRRFMDGDMSADMITLDNKDQSSNTHPVVNMAELQKVREDAKRANKPLGGLVLRNRFGVGVVVFLESDFGAFLGAL
jgi:hypothetical protein